MERPIADVPFHELKIGQKVRSALGTEGKITEFLPEKDNTIVIQWVSGGVSFLYHHLGDKVKFID